MLRHMARVMGLLQSLWPSWAACRAKHSYKLTLGMHPAQVLLAPCTTGPCSAWRVMQQGVGGESLQWSHNHNTRLSMTLLVSFSRSSAAPLAGAKHLPQHERWPVGWSAQLGAAECRL